MKKIKKLVKTAAAISTIGLGFATVSVSEARAASLVPQTEGEIETYVNGSKRDCLDPNVCIQESELGYTVTSLAFQDFDASRLFSDNRATENSYGLGITFIAEDEGTNPEVGEFWLRPVAFKDGEVFEDGRLEAGLFEFDLGKTVSELRLDFFDVEYDKSTAIVKINGQDIQDLFVDAGDDSNIQTVVLKDLRKFTVQLGEAGGRFGTGDGVSLQVSVPESENLIGLSALAVAGVLTLKRRKSASQKA